MLTEYADVPDDLRERVKQLLGEYALDNTNAMV